MRSKKAQKNTMTVPKDIMNILVYGNKEQKRSVFCFGDDDSVEEIVFKFYLFISTLYPAYFSRGKAPFHELMATHYACTYLGYQNYLNIGFRGCAKTTLMKLFATYVFLNDTRISRRKFVKIITKDMTNSKAIVTDVYNMMMQASHIYGNPFEGGNLKKREESMRAFVTASGVRFAASTVGQVQRGQTSGSSRPDLAWFEDIEDSETIESATVTDNIIKKCDEAIQGLSDDGTYVVTANYISDQGIIQWFKDKQDLKKMITPIVDLDGKPTWRKFTPERLKKIEADALDWAGDYLCDPNAKSNKFFDREKLLIMKRDIRKPKRVSGFVKFYDKYFPHATYGIGADVSEGVGLDSSAMCLYNYKTNEIVGTCHDPFLDPSNLGHEMIRVGEEFGSALLVPENNNMGHTTVQVLKDEDYSNLYMEQKDDEVSDRSTKKIGWNTNRRTKHDMWFEFRDAINDGAIKVYDEDLLDEMMRYTREDFLDDKKYESATHTRHFDLLTAAVIGWQGKSQAYFNKDMAKKKRKKKQELSRRRARRTQRA